MSSSFGLFSSSLKIHQTIVRNLHPFSINTMANKRNNISLPPRIIRIILAKLPVKSLCQSKAVCKRWRDLISSRAFAREHLRHAQGIENFSFHKFMFVGFLFSSQQMFSRLLDFSTFARLPLALSFGYHDLSCKVLASCNGLLLIYKGLRTYVLWNPSTGAFKEFSGLHRSMSVDSYSSFYGIAYDATSDKYKVISAVRIGDSEEETVVSIHDCTTRTTACSSGGFPYYIARSQQGADVNGIPHWLVSHGPGTEYAIICFDFSSQTFGEVPIPKWADNYCVLELMSHKGKLCLVNYRRGYVEIWVMESYGEIESWRNLYGCVRSSCDLGMRPLGVSHDGQVVMEVEQHKIVLYDPRKRVFSKTKSYTCRSPNFGSITYVESLVSP